mgnify:CR=1 FL=1
MFLSERFYALFALRVYIANAEFRVILIKAVVENVDYFMAIEGNQNVPRADSASLRDRALFDRIDNNRQKITPSY